MSDNSDHLDSSCFPSTSYSASMHSSPPSFTSTQSPAQLLMTRDVDLKILKDERLIRCHVCNKEHIDSTFIDLPCSHKFCSHCASMMGRTQLCPLCFNKFATSTNTDMTSSRPNSVFPDRRSDLPNITVDTAFSIWDPLTPKTQKFDISRTVRASPPIFSPPSPIMDRTTCLPTPPIFSLPPPMNCTVNWHTAPSASIRSPLEFSFPNCSMCAEEGAKASVRCEQCEETLCADCVLAHYRVRITRDHRLLPVENYKGLPVPQVASVDECVKYDEPNNAETCSIHDSPLVCVCKICGNSLLCHMCVAEHSKHQLVPHGEIRSAVLTLIAGSKHDQKNLEESLESVHRMSERVDASVQAVVRELRSVIHLHISALEERKRDLLQRVDTIRQAKMGTLKIQSDRISQRLASLNEVLKAAELSASSGEGSDGNLRNSFDALMNVFREPCVYLLPHDTDLIKFIPPDSSLITRMRNLGELDSGACAHTSHLVGEAFKRAIRDRMCSIHVQTRDACGDVCTSLNNMLTASIIGPDGQPLQIHTIERENGLYTLNYLPMMDGNHTLDVLIRGVSISGCPTVIHIRKGRNYSAVSRIGSLFAFGSEGSGDGQLCRPWGICCDNQGRILVADRSNNRIQIFDKEGNFLSKFGSPGTRAGQFDRPAGIAVNSMNNVIVADKDNHRVQVFAEDGEFLLKFGERGRTPGMFNYPWGVAVNSFNQIAVSDTRNHRVQIFSPQGQFIRKCGFDASLFYKNLDSPRGVCYLHDGQLIITDFNNHRLAVVSSRGSSEMKCYGSEGECEGYFCRPQGVATDNEGHILVCDSRNNRIQVLNADDMHCIATFGGAQSNTNSIKPSSTCSSTISPPSGDVNLPASSNDVSGCYLDRPTDLCVSPDGLIYVVDFGNNCVRVY